MINTGSQGWAVDEADGRTVAGIIAPVQRRKRILRAAFIAKSLTGKKTSRGVVPRFAERKRSPGNEACSTSECPSDMYGLQVPYVSIHLCVRGEESGPYPRPLRAGRRFP